MKTYLKNVGNFNDFKAMKKVTVLAFPVLLVFFTLIMTGCDKTEAFTDSEEVILPEEDPGIPEGYFVASFSAAFPGTKAPINTTDTRVQSLRYVIYKSTGEYVKERLVFSLNGTATKWPLTTLRDTLPKGSYRAVFLANTEKTQFPFPTSSTTTGYADILLNYQTTYSNARIALPNAEFKDNSEYYWANVTFSNSSSSPYILLQRIIGMMNVHRNVIDAQQALNKLVNNIVTNIGYKDILKTTAQGILTTEIKRVVGENVPAVTIALLGGIDAIVNPIVAKVVQPVTDTLYNRFLRQLVNQIGVALQANANQNGLLGVLGELLNPWEFSQSSTAIVDINNFPKTIDFALNVVDKYTGIHRFRYDFTSDAFFAQKCIYIKGFSGLFDIRKINVIKRGLISGVVFDGIVDGPLLLNGAFIDINDPLSYTPAANRRYKADYSILDVGLKSYQQQTDGNHSLTVNVKLTEIANIDGLLGGVPILNTILNLVLSPIKNITVSTPLNLPLLGVDNLTISGGWSTPTRY